MKKAYEKAEIDVVFLSRDDVISTSQPSIEDTDFEGGQSPW
jgi:hypothetical protein